MIPEPPMQNKMLKKSELESGKNYKCILSKKEEFTNLEDRKAEFLAEIKKEHEESTITRLVYVGVVFIVFLIVLAVIFYSIK